jgi:hypothetical protein
MQTRLQWRGHFHPSTLIHLSQPLAWTNAKTSCANSPSESSRPTLKLADLGGPLGNLTRLNPVVPLAQHDTPLLPHSIPCRAMVGDTRQFLDTRARKAPNRQSRSCKVCRLRKVKVRIVLRSPSAGPFTHPMRLVPLTGNVSSIILTSLLV